MPRYCIYDQRVLTRDTSSGFPIFICKCGSRFDGDDDDSLISSSFVRGQLDVLTILKFADKDPVNAQANIKCPVCHRIYMTQVGPEPLFFFKCSRCQTVLNGDETIYKMGKI